MNNRKSRLAAVGIAATLFAVMAVIAPRTTLAQSIDHSGGFASHGDLTANGSATFVGTEAQLTNTFGQAGSIFSDSKVCIANFTTAFPFHIIPLSSPPADGVTFTMQGDGATALGAPGGDLGYVGILQSVAVRLDYGFDNFGEGTNATGLFTTGASLGSFSVTNVDPVSPINLQDADPKSVTSAYDGTNLSETITDLNTHLSFSHTYAINIPAFVGGSTSF